jgi:hypothetical protein
MQKQQNIDTEKSSLISLAVVIADAERFRWEHTGNAPESSALIGLELRRIDGEHVTLDERCRGHDVAAGNTIGAELEHTAMGRFAFGLVAERDTLRTQIADLTSKALETPACA